MSPATLLFALQVLQAIPQLIAAGQSVMTLVNQASSAMQSMIAEKRDPNPEEWAALDAVTDELRKRLHEPAKP